ncbi:hypothetical protein BDA99DRAFT_154979 [Phascolomyces articulosus]|uniref:Uncharacterized protein n=1 Tax=Phascolomyces articulosus TaxID=60185 RepID=A0AAD5JUY5_9FUNG|nr:hypothetical protein BDA99DRAFT_154979 [Phascolomyces articulosus]
MTSSCCCNCFSSSKRHQLSLEPEEEPNAFDLTWRNYLLPSSSCCCIPNIFKRKHQPIRLGDDDDDMIDDELFISPHQHFDRQNINNHNQYHGRAVRGYLDDPRDWEFDSMFTEGEFPAGVVTRNPFGRKNSKKKRKHKKHHPRVIQQQDDEEIFSEEIQDAEFLGDDQIAHLAYERSKVNNITLKHSESEGKSKRVFFCIYIYIIYMSRCISGWIWHDR